MSQENNMNTLDPELAQEIDQEATESLAAEENELPSLEEVNQVLQERIETLEGQIKDNDIRHLADIQNLHRRHQEEIEAAHKFAATKFATEMLPIKDYLEMALKDESGQFDTLKMGVEMTLKQLVLAFEKTKIQEINPIGEILDPHKHQAMTTEVSQEEPNTVLKVMQKGYEMNDRVLRPAMVIVAKKED